MSDMHQVFYECLAKERLAALEAEAARAALIRSLRGPRRPLRVMLGKGLVAVGRWVLGPVTEWTDEPSPVPVRLPSRGR